ncbi:uncharacterized protein LOC113292742 [Papaver somniferum]|uniref:uncharacterized protein LOC113292742 n=1 Tax=Papaver somniferum TaxID=3469 RepID=UPI000E703639|nr:uncharacterized protein LOC113292742 [Papaver somniferum]XP_026397397.1 uncharacterized protein LOC113292742 [Papaver somniferum]
MCQIIWPSILLWGLFHKSSGHLNMLENKIHKLAKKEGLVVEAARGLAWMNGHVGKDGIVNPSAVEKYEQVKAARARRQDLINAGLASASDFENDEIAEVFGPEKCRAGLLGYSPLVSKKQALYASVAMRFPISIAPMTDHMDEALLPKHTELITNVVLQVMARQQQNQHSSSTNPGTGGVEYPYGNQVVLLYNRKREVVATGHVVYGIDGEHCEGLLVQLEERKVCLETIEDGNCVVPDSPQGDRCYLREYVVNESVIWIVFRMEFMESAMNENFFSNYFLCSGNISCFLF